MKIIVSENREVFLSADRKTIISVAFELNIHFWTVKTISKKLSTIGAILRLREKEIKENE